MGTGAFLIPPAWQFENECRPVADAVAVRGKPTPQFAGRQRTAVQAESMSILSGGKSVGKNPRQVFLGNAHAIVDHRNLHAMVVIAQPDRELLVRPPGFVAGILGIADK